MTNKDRLTSVLTNVASGALLEIGAKVRRLFIEEDPVDPSERSSVLRYAVLGRAREVRV